MADRLCHSARMLQETARRARHHLLLPLLLVLPAPSQAQPVQQDILPGPDAVAIRTYGLGLLPLDGQFTRFSGVLRYDPADHAACAVALRIQAESLDMATGSMTAMIRGPDFLDTEHFPLVVYRGSCTATGLQGQLSMHGVTRPFALALDWGAAHLVATGSLQRADWGMTARRLLGGDTVRITVTLPLPRLASARP